MEDLGRSEKCGVFGHRKALFVSRHPRQLEFSLAKHQQAPRQHRQHGIQSTTKKCIIADIKFK
jgi:hypothetical protein